MSNLNAQERVAKPRNYRLGKRAEKQQETRRKIVEATVTLHGTIGPARTTVAQIAELAGVQRHTFYAHFPEERDLMMACSGLSLERDPLPDPDSWLEIPAGPNRLEQGLGAFYAWFERNASLSACVLRDAEVHQPTREAVELRMAPAFARAAIVLGDGLGPAAQALLAVALDFHCWRTLVTADSTSNPAATMSRAIVLLDSGAARA